MPAPLIVLWLSVLNTVTLLTFGFDKWRARRSGWRVPEWVLVLLGALGGWPAGFCAMRWFRHKTVKWTFQLKYGLGLIPFALELWFCFHRR